MLLLFPISSLADGVQPASLPPARCAGYRGGRNTTIGSAPKKVHMDVDVWNLRFMLYLLEGAETWVHKPLQLLDPRGGAGAQEVVGIHVVSERKKLRALIALS